MYRRVFKIITCFLLVALLSACHSVYKKQDTVQSLESASIEPKEVFVYEGALYFTYTYSGVDFALIAKLPKEGKELKKKNATIEAKAVKTLPEMDAAKKEKVYMLGDVFEQAVRRQMTEMAPQDHGTGYLLVTDLRDVVLYRDTNGEIKLNEPGQVPLNITILGKKKQKELRQGVNKYFTEILKADYPGVTKFVIPIDRVAAQIPYIYVDAEREFVSAIELPDFYKVQKKISPVGFSVDMLYSFFIKSNFIGVVKAPFTSVHNLLSSGYFFMYATLSPGIKNLSYDVPPLYDGDQMMDLEEFSKVLDRKTRKETYKARAKLLIGGEEFFPDFIEEVQKAKESVDVRIYIFKTDPYSLSIADVLKNASNHDIKTRVLIDEINTVLNWTKAPEMPHSKDYVMPGIKQYLKEESEVKVRTRPNILASVDHSKVIVIDERLAYTGGMNFGEEYRYTWHDMMISLEGPIVTKLKNDFERAWAFSGPGGDFAQAAVMASEDCNECFKHDYEDDMIDVRPLYTKPSRPDIFTAQLEAIKRAKKRIYIQNAYFSDNRIVKELINARQRGVDVRVILPSKNDIGMMDANNRVKTNIMLANGIRVYYYPTMSHVKAAIYDGWACVGSANFDKYSLFVNGEMSLGVDDPKFVEELNERLFQKDFAVSQEITEPLELTSQDYFLAAISLQA
ncbi:phosphatidylserine/phosphatidylglycerophosphate/cardiolipin synthase-like enzyme [Elusimicrobium simillimum]|uniref:phospholipase D-like domain-containing protein n=1 Tax=Elusimicrobium simillimum TaxID=3143438 RepID=UPI003C6FA472